MEGVSVLRAYGFPSPANIYDLCSYFSVQGCRYHCLNYIFRIKLYFDNCFEVYFYL